MKTGKQRRFLLFLLILVFCTLSLSAYQLSPLSVTFSSSGADSSKVYTIVNDSDSPIAIEMSAVRRALGKDGEEITTDGSAFFSIQPAKMIIKPQSTQLVRVQYRGPRTVSQEQSFRIIASQIPYSLGAQQQTEGQMINFLFVYSTAAYVEPSRIVESVSTSASWTEDGRIAISIKNTGSVHQVLDKLSVTVTDGNNSYSLSESELDGKTGLNLLTGSEIEIIIDTPEGFSVTSPVSASSSYSYSYN